MNTKRRITKAVVIYLLLVGVVDAKADDSSLRESGGFRLGMTPQEARTSFRTHNPPLKEVDNYPPQKVLGVDSLPEIMGVYGAGTTNSYTVFLQFSPPPLASHVVQIHRIVNYDNANAPTVENTKTSLLSKYKQPKVAGMFWAWAPDGSPTNPIPCSTSPAAFMNNMHNMKNPPVLW